METMTVSPQDLIDFGNYERHQGFLAGIAVAGALVVAWKNKKKIKAALHKITED